MNTSWIWANENGSYGLVLEPEHGRLKWYDAIDGSCDGDPLLIQTMAEFATQGIPGMVAPPPADVLDELKIALKQIAKQSLTPL